MRDPTQCAGARRPAPALRSMPRRAARPRCRATQRHQTKSREGPEEPPLDRVEQVADRGEPAGVRQRLEVGWHQAVGPALVPARGRPTYAPYRSSSKLLREVCHPQLRQHVVGRVVVGEPAVPSEGWSQPTRSAAPLGSGPRSAPRGCRLPAADHRQQRVADPDGIDHPVAVLAFVLAVRRPRRCRPPRRRAPRPAARPAAPGNGSSGPIASASGIGATCVRSRASASRRACHPSYCHSPSHPAATSSTTSSKWVAQ